MTAYAYRRDVLDALWRHGVQPSAATPPELVRGFVRDLYKYEIRELRARLLRNEFARREYAGRVEALRHRYPVLTLTARQWVLNAEDAGGADGR